MNQQGIVFSAIIHQVKIDKEGESKITLTVPLVNRDEVLEVGKLTEQVLEVSIVPVPQKITQKQGELTSW